MAATATIHGTLGDVTVNDITAKFVSWTATLNGELFDTTGFTDDGWQNNQIITLGVTGSAIGVIATTIPVAQTAFAEPAGLTTMEGEVVLTVSTGKTWTFDASITAVELGRSETGTGNSTFRVDFTSAGDVAQAWA